MSIENYRSLYDLPQLAGLCTVAKAVDSRGWSVDESTRRWKRLHYCLKRACEAITARITAEPIYELKLLFSHHAYLLSEQVTSVRQRVSEMREPPLGLDKIPHAALQRLMDDLYAMGELQAFMRGLYEVVLPAVLDATERLQQHAHPVADAPTVRAAKLIAFELKELISTGQAACGALTVSHEKSASQTQPGGVEPINCGEWTEHLQTCIKAAGQIDGHQSTNDDKTSGESDACTVPQAFPNDRPFVYSHVPKRDQRFKDSYNAGVNPEAFLYDERFSAQDKTLMMYYKRLREIDVPETMASMLVELQDKPWNFYREMLRQLWDEARHAMMGEIGFASLGIDWTQIPINFTWSLNLNTQLTPQERHGVLFFIEQGLMPRTGKRYEWEVGLQSEDSLSALFQDFDWADEVLHAQIGRRWYVPQFESLQESLKYGDECWSRVLSHFQTYREQGLTQHRNWWPEIYRQACQHWGKQPDPTALEFSTDYSNSRADLKSIS
jgi:hypothetical protein